MLTMKNANHPFALYLGSMKNPALVKGSPTLMIQSAKMFGSTKEKPIKKSLNKYDLRRRTCGDVLDYQEQTKQEKPGTVA